jgi:hypothetical protein
MVGSDIVFRGRPRRRGCISDSLPLNVYISDIAVMVQTRYIQQWYPLAIYLGHAEDKRKNGRREDRKALYKGQGGARALVVAPRPSK